MAATQEALYQAHDLELSWSEASLPERERTKHVHRLHPYLGKFIPQLVETLLERHVPAGGRVLDPFAGSGTTLVQALESGYDATGVDIAGFNALLARVKTRPVQPRRAAARSPLGARRGRGVRSRAVATRATASAYVRAWYAPTAAEELLHFRVARRAGRLGRRAARRSRPLGPLGAPHRTFRSRVPARAAARAILVLQASARVPAGRGGAALPAALHARHARPDRDVRGGRVPRAASPACCTATPA